MSDFKPVPIETTLAAFEDLHNIFMKRAEAVMSEYQGCDPRIVKLGLDKLDEIAFDVAKWVEETDNGCWPRDVRPVLGKTMKSLVEKKNQLKDSAKQSRVVPVLDLSNMQRPSNDGLLN